MASLANGLYAHQHGITGNDPALLPGMTGGAEPPGYRALRERLISRIDRHPTLPKLLGEAGYLSHQSGKWWEGNYRRGGFTHGMTRGFPEPGGRHGDDGLRIGREGMAPVFEFMDHAVAAAQHPEQVARLAARLQEWWPVAEPSGHETETGSESQTAETAQPLHTK